MVEEVLQEVSGQIVAAGLPDPRSPFFEGCSVFEVDAVDVAGKDRLGRRAGMRTVDVCDD